MQGHPRYIGHREELTKSGPLEENGNPIQYYCWRIPWTVWEKAKICDEEDEPLTLEDIQYAIGEDYYQ